MRIPWLLACIVAPLAGQGVVTGVVRSGDVRVAGAVVWLEPLDAPPPVQVPDTVMMDQRGLEFLPGRWVLRPGDVVVFPNSDPLRHNVFSPGLRGGAGAFNLGTYPRGEIREHAFTEPGAHVILCHIHPDMLAWIVVAASPWRAIVAADGRFQFTDVPPGRYRLHTWHARAHAASVPVRVEGSRGPSVTIDLVRP